MKFIWVILIFSSFGAFGSTMIDCVYSAEIEENITSLQPGDSFLAIRVPLTVTIKKILKEPHKATPVCVEHLGKRTTLHPFNVPLHFLPVNLSKGSTIKILYHYSSPKSPIPIVETSWTYYRE